MRINHILNIGYPKCGTTWCWTLLTQQTWFTNPGDKENNDLIERVTVADYTKIYIDSNITANFSTANFTLDRYIIKQLSELPTTTASIILRNPFDLYWSLYNFMPNPLNTPYNTFVNNLIKQSWFHRPAHIINRWQQFFEKDRFCIFFYDDLQKNSSDFFNNYCKQMRLPTPTILDTSLVNVTEYKNTSKELHPDLVTLINQEIDNLQVYVDYDVLKWKR